MLNHKERSRKSKLSTYITLFQLLEQRQRRTGVEGANRLSRRRSASKGSKSIGALCSPTACKCILRASLSSASSIFSATKVGVICMEYSNLINNSPSSLKMGPDERGAACLKRMSKKTWS